MNNSYTKIIIKNNVRIYLSDYQKVIQDILTLHQYTPLASLIMANGIAAFGPLGLLYDLDKLSILIKTNGAMKVFVLEFNKNNLRALLGDGTVITEYDDNGLYNSIPLILGMGDEGVVRVTKFVNDLPYTSEVPLANGDMITDLAYYLNKSDQVFSAIQNDIFLNRKNHLKVDKAKSIIFQLLPDHHESDILWIENIIKQNQFETTELQEYEKIIDGIELKKVEIKAKCSCSPKKMINVIKLLPKKDQKELFEKNHHIEIKCDFCLRVVNINVNDLEDHKVN